MQVHEAKIPDVRLPKYDTLGTIPKFTGAGVDFAVVNRAFTAMVHADQRAYRKQYHELYEPSDFAGPYRGVYEVTTDPCMVVADTQIVSAMLDLVALYPGGNDGTGWLSATVKVPSAQPIALADLFPANFDWLEFLAKETKAGVQRMGLERCFPAETDEIAREFLEYGGLSPKPENFRHFALAPNSLDIGVEHGQLGSGACGASRISIPWLLIRDALSDEGRRLAYLASASRAMTAPTQEGSSGDCAFTLSPIHAGAALGSTSVHVALNDEGRTCEVEGVASLEIRTESGELDKRLSSNPSRVRVVAQVVPGRTVWWETSDDSGGPFRAELAWLLSGLCGRREVTIAFGGQKVTDLFPESAEGCGSGGVRLLREAMRPPGIQTVDEL